MFHFEKRLERQLRQGNLRELTIRTGLIDFASNDYLGLARSKSLQKLTEKEMQEEPLNGLGSTGSRLLTGNSHVAEKLEESIAYFHGFQAGLLYSCGYMANLGLLTAIAGTEEAIFFDSRIHASTREGIRLSRANPIPFRHNDLDHLENRLKRCQAKGDRFICIESIYSTNGSIAPLKEICQLASRFGAGVIVDEAHAIGVCGPAGRGLAADAGVISQLFAQVVTFGKGLGTFGAIVLGNTALKQAMINFSTACIYTTALPLQALQAIKSSYQLFPNCENERMKIKDLVQFFSSSSKTHIQPISIRGVANTKLISEKLAEAGFDVRALTSPTVRRGEECLRLCLHAYNSEIQLREVLTLIRNY